MSKQRPSDLVPDEVKKEFQQLYVQAYWSDGPLCFNQLFDAACDEHNFDPFAVVRWPGAMTFEQAERFGVIWDRTTGTGWPRITKAYREFAAEENAELDKPKVPRPGAEICKSAHGLFYVFDAKRGLFLHPCGWIAGQTCMYPDEPAAQAALDKWREENPNG